MSLSNEETQETSGEDDEGDCYFDCEDVVQEKRRHILEGNGGGSIATNAWSKYIKRLVRKDLESLGICLQTRNEGRQGRRPKQLCGRSGRSASRAGSNALADFNTHSVLDNSILIQNLVPITLNDGKTQICIPLFLKVSCDFIRQSMDHEGIFRKPGASSRKQRIVQDLLRVTAKDDLNNLFKIGDTVYDVCSALTQILRNLQNPLIPYELHGVILSCLELKTRKLSVRTLLEAICLLPSSSISVLSYFVQFLQEVSQHSSKNLMVTNNLGVVMVENIMPTMPKNDTADCSRTPTTPPSINPRERIDRHSHVIETLIEYADRVGYLSSRLQERIRENPMSLSDAGSSDEDGGENSPRKKRRSSSLNRLFGNIFRKNAKQTKPVDSGNLPIMKTPLSLTGHTPVIKDGSRKFSSKTDQLNSIYSGHKTNQLLLKKTMGLPQLNVTPYQALRSTPAVSLNPSPKVSAQAETPFGPKRKYFGSSNLLKKRFRTSPPEQQEMNIKEAAASVANKSGLLTSNLSELNLVQLETSPRKLQDTKLKASSTTLGKSPRPRPHSFNSPRTTPTSGNTAITRSPSTRRTLRRGRPNTLRVGLTRPSPTNNVVKIESSPPTSGRLLRSSSCAAHVVKKESFMWGGDTDTSPRKKITIEPSGRVISRNSSGRPALEIPKTSVPETESTPDPNESSKSKIDDTPVDKTRTKSDDSVINNGKSNKCKNMRETQLKTPLMRVNTSSNVSNSGSPRKAAATTRSQSMRDSTRSYIPRLIVNGSNMSRKSSFRDGLEDFEEESQPTPKTPIAPPQKSVSTSAITPQQQQLKRRNSVQELVKLYESTAMMSKIPSAINQENGRAKPYPFAVRTLDRVKLDPYNKYNSITRPNKLQYGRPIWSTLPEQNLTKQQ